MTAPARPLSQALQALQASQAPQPPQRAAAPAALPLAAQVQALQALFQHIADTRMLGVPVSNPRLRVTAVGFAPEPGGAGACGVLVTPWFMNLVWLPLDPAAEALPVRARRTRAVGGERFEFLGAQEDGFGPFEACSLFSPMFQFEDQRAAIATAEAVIQALRPAPTPSPAPNPAAEPMPARRAWWLARGPRGAEGPR